MILTTPSYLVPGTWLENLKVASAYEWIEGVELLFFSFDDDARSILSRDLERMAAWKERFSFSLHLPDPLDGSVFELVELTRDFVDEYVMHPPKNDATMYDIEHWYTFVTNLRSGFGDDFLLEYTGAAAFAAAESHFPNLPLCADTGRLLLDGIDPASWCLEGLERLREVHLHGVEAGRDHAPLKGSEAWLHTLAPLLGSLEGRVELEVFSLAGATASAAALAAALPIRASRAKV